MPITTTTSVASNNHPRPFYHSSGASVNYSRHYHGHNNKFNNPFGVTAGNNRSTFIGRGSGLRRGSCFVGRWRGNALVNGRSATTTAIASSRLYHHNDDNNRKYHDVGAAKTALAVDWRDVLRINGGDGDAGASGGRSVYRRPRRFPLAYEVSPDRTTTAQERCVNEVPVEVAAPSSPRHTGYRRHPRRFPPAYEVSPDRMAAPPLTTTSVERAKDAEHRRGDAIDAELAPPAVASAEKPLSMAQQLTNRELLQRMRSAKAEANVDAYHRFRDTYNERVARAIKERKRQPLYHHHQPRYSLANIHVAGVGGAAHLRRRRRDEDNDEARKRGDKRRGQRSETPSSAASSSSQHRQRQSRRNKVAAASEEEGMRRRIDDAKMERSAAATAPTATLEVINNEEDEAMAAALHLLDELEEVDCVGADDEDGETTIIRGGNDMAASANVISSRVAIGGRTAAIGEKERIVGVNDADADDGDAVTMIDLAVVVDDTAAACVINREEMPMSRRIDDYVGDARTLAAASSSRIASPSKRRSRHHTPRGGKGGVDYEKRRHGLEVEGRTRKTALGTTVVEDSGRGYHDQRRRHHSGHTTGSKSPRGDTQQRPHHRYRERGDISPEAAVKLRSGGGTGANTSDAECEIPIVGVTASTKSTSSPANCIFVNAGDEFSHSHRERRRRSPQTPPPTLSSVTTSTLFKVTIPAAPPDVPTATTAAKGLSMDELAVREVIEYDDSDGFEERREDSEKVEETTHNGVVNATAKSKRKHHDDSDDKGVNHRRRHQKRRKDDLVG